MKTRILLLDDDDYTRKLFAGILKASDVELHTATTCAQARRIFHSFDFNLAILDQRLPDGNGLDLFGEFRGERRRLVALLITGYAEVRDAMRAVREGLFDYLTKPFEDLGELEHVIRKALEMDRAYREIAKLQETLDACPDRAVMIGGAPVMENLLAQLHQAAPLDTTVLIEGESGTGKELLAKRVHSSSARAGGPFLKVNCGALSESLLEATLFGYEKGAFTSAAKTTPGYFEEVNGGTLLLDEITDMSPKLQASLLRVLEERTFTRLGSTAPRPTDFRLICATNKSLQLEMKAGRFRPDLYYRINVMVLRAPSLRERREDIAPLAIYFLDYFNQKFRKSAGPFTPDAMAALETADWPGNVRELRHSIERAVVVNASGPITAIDLGLRALAGSSSGAAAAEFLPLREARERFERDYFENVLESTQGNVSQAARLSGIARQNFYSYLQRLGIVMKS